MTLRGLGFVLVLCGSGCVAGAATGTAKGKSVNVRIEAEDRLQAARVAMASAAAADLFDELTQAQLPKPLEIRGRLAAGGPAVPEAKWSRRGGYGWRRTRRRRILRPRGFRRW